MKPTTKRLGNTLVTTKRSRKSFTIASLAEQTLSFSGKADAKANQLDKEKQAYIEPSEIQGEDFTSDKSEQTPATIQVKSVKKQPQDIEFNEIEEDSEIDSFFAKLNGIMDKKTTEKKDKKVDRVFSASVMSAFNNDHAAIAKVTRGLAREFPSLSKKSRDEALEEAVYTALKLINKGQDDKRDIQELVRECAFDIATDKDIRY